MLQNEIRICGVINFLVSSRNDIDHPEDDGKDDLVSGEFVAGFTSLRAPTGNMGGIRLSDQTSFKNLIMKDNVIDGQLVSAVVNKPAAETAQITGNARAVRIMPKFSLKPIRTKDGQIIHVPTHPKLGEVFSAQDLATHAMPWLEKALKSLLSESDINSVSPS